VVTKKHREKKLRDFCERFVHGARERGVEDQTIEAVWQMMMGFDGYSFCKPHSASYTMVAYKSAFLRAHYPAEFMASVISNGGGYYSTFGYLSEARRMGLRIRPPCINQSDIKYTGKGKEIRMGLMQLKDLSHAAQEAIIHERSRNGPFNSLADFLDRTRSHVHLQDVKILIKAGCFDAIAHGTQRPGLMWQALRFFDQHAPAQQTLPLGGTALPPPAGNTAPMLSSPHNLDGWTPPALKINEPCHAQSSYPKQLMLRHESEIFGFILSAHPLDLYADRPAGRDYVRAKELHQWVGKGVTTIGWQVTGKTVRTKAGDPMKFVTFEDQTGIYETVFFPKAYHRFCHMLNAERPYLLKGTVQENRGAITMTVNWIGFLDQMPQRERRELAADTRGQEKTP
jgi:error-prone DNA polymerase